MKRYSFLAAALTLVFAACMKDKGNYDYNEINEATITNIPGTVSGIFGDTLTLRPELHFTQDAGDGSDTTLYSHKWVIFFDNKITTIASTRDFNQPLNNINTGTYSAAYMVKDKKSGVTYHKYFTLIVTTAAYEGWFVLGKSGDSSRLDFVGFDGVSYDSKRMYTDVLEQFNSEYPRPIGKPLGLHTASKNRDYTIMISTDKGSNSLDRNTLKWDRTKNIAYLCFGTVPKDFAPTMFWSVFTNYHMYDKGTIYTYTNATLFNMGAPANQLANEPRPFRASPYFNVGTTAGLSTSLVMFDMDKKRFAKQIIRTQGVDAYAVPFNNPSGAKFDFNNVGMDLVWMSRSYIGYNIFCVLKNSAGEYYFALFNESSSEQLIFQKMNISALDVNSLIVADPQWSTLYFSSGNKLYAYYPDANQERMIQDFGEKITYLFFPTNIPSAKVYDVFRTKLLVSTFDASKPETGGKLRFFQTFNQGAPTQITHVETLTGFGEVVGAQFRSRAGGY